MLSPRPSSSSARVLVIDDDDIVLESIRTLLSAAGYEVHCLASPIGATQFIVTRQIQAVVVDLNMPVMQGDRFISLLRSWDKIRSIPTILLSGAAPETLHAVAGKLPGVLAVSKDSMHRTLPETLGRILSRPSTARASTADNGAANGPSPPGKWVK